MALVNREQIIQNINELMANGNIEEAKVMIEEQSVVLGDYYDQLIKTVPEIEVTNIPFLETADNIASIKDQVSSIFGNISSFFGK
ncbi:hypothetical protein [Enterococcus casseliflavus]|uniref:hypothetical protein n=1 Tax=Enterococcus casseliflavus TaxID=37734 RepID=UPI0039A5D5E6